ncbi:MAG: PilZ domain-containing protein [Candidatus Omnitrophota bacterium]|nr:MAG: PilZ domain-containing protein [Candidatus Omnitrophota bacterium]
MPDSNFEEKRRFPRVESRFPLKYKDLKKTDEESRGSISKNLSENGVRFRSDRFISLACRLVIEMNFPALSKPVKAISKVAWIRKLPVGDDYEVGNQFLEIAKEDKNIIQSFVKTEFRIPSL